MAEVVISMNSEYSLEYYYGDIYMIVGIDDKMIKQLKKNDDKLTACTVVLAEAGADILRINDKFIEESILEYYSPSDVIKMVDENYEVILDTKVKDPYIGKLFLVNPRKKYTYNKTITQ